MAPPRRQANNGGGTAKDTSEAFQVPYLPTDSPAAVDPEGLKLPLLPHQLVGLALITTLFLQSKRSNLMTASTRIVHAVTNLTHLGVMQQPYEPRAL
jgi:hypothetical protein